MRTVLHGSILPVASAGLLSDFILSLGSRASMLGTDPRRFQRDVRRPDPRRGPPVPPEFVQKSPEDGTEDSMLQRWRAEAYVDANLSSRTLGPDQLAKAVGLSRSALYRTFQLYGRRRRVHPRASRRAASLAAPATSRNADDRRSRRLARLRPGVALQPGLQGSLRNVSRSIPRRGARDPGCAECRPRPAGLVGLVEPT